MQHRVYESCFAVIDVSDDSYIAKVIATILGLRHTSLLGSNLVLSSDNRAVEFGGNSVVISMFLDNAHPLDYFDHLNGAA